MNKNRFTVIQARLKLKKLPAGGNSYRYRVEQRIKCIERTRNY